MRKFHLTVQFKDQRGDVRLWGMDWETPALDEANLKKLWQALAKTHNLAPDQFVILHSLELDAP